MADPIIILGGELREEYRKLRKGAVIEIDCGSEFHVGYFDHVDNNDLYMGNTTKLGPAPQEPCGL